jgi:mevalonate kinase
MTVPRVTASASGKVILLGEHAVVYGVPAIAASLSRGARATARPAEAAQLSIGTSKVTPGDGSDLGKAFGELLAELGNVRCEVELEVDLPVGAGLGSSAAMAVATARAVIGIEGGSDDERVLRAATAWERVFHGNPSGIDTAAAALSGCLWFTKSEGATPIALGAPLCLAIAIAAPPASTKLMVESVARLKERRPSVVEKALEGIRSLVRNARLALEAGDVPGLGGLLDLNHMILAGLHLSTEELEHARQIARDAGALGAKLTGAGGGGSVVALCDRDAEPVLTAWRSANIECFGASVG